MFGMHARSIMKSINVLNVLLAAVLIALAAYILPPLTNLDTSYTVPAAKKMTEEKEEPAPVAQPPSAVEYTVIAEQNVFHPERKIVAENKDEKPLPKPEFVLYGTLIAGDTSLAFIEDLKAPYTTSSRGKRQRTLRLGEPLSGFTLSEVHPDRVLMVRGEERMELKVIDASRAKTRETGATAAPQPQVSAGRAGTTPAVRQPRTAPGIGRSGNVPTVPPQRQILPRTPQANAPGTP